MMKIIVIMLLFISYGHASERPDYVRRIRKNALVFGMIKPFMLHPNRAGIRDAAKTYFPKKYKTRNDWPLVVLLHGIYVSGSFQDMFFGLRSRVNRGYVLLIPGSTYDQNGMRFWNSGRACCDYFSSNADDVGFLKGLISEFINKERINPRKVIIVGHSNGAFMAQKLACDTKGLISKVISFAGVMDKDVVCQSNPDLKMELVHDRDDQHILYKGMSNLELTYRIEHNSMYPLREAYVGAEENFEQWKNILGPGSVKFKVTTGQGHIPNLSRKARNRLVRSLIN